MSNISFEALLTHASTHLFALELPVACEEQRALDLLKAWGVGLCQAAFRGAFGYLNLPQFSAVLTMASSGASRWVVFAELSSPWELGLEALASSTWSDIAPGCFIHMLRRPQKHPEKVEQLIRSADFEQRITSVSLGIPPRDGRILSSDGPVPFFAEHLIPVWSDARVWISTNLGGDYFGLVTSLGRNGLGDCMLAHCFYMEGEELCTTNRAVPVQANELGMHLRAMLTEYVSPDATVRPLDGLKGGGIESGDQLHDEILSFLRTKTEAIGSGTGNR